MRLVVSRSPAAEELAKYASGEAGRQEIVPETESSFPDSRVAMRTAKRKVEWSPLFPAKNE